MSGYTAWNLNNYTISGDLTNEQQDFGSERSVSLTVENKPDGTHASKPDLEIFVYSAHGEKHHWYLPYGQRAEAKIGKCRRIKIVEGTHAVVVYLNATADEPNDLGHDTFDIKPTAVYTIPT